MGVIRRWRCIEFFVFECDIGYLMAFSLVVYLTCLWDMIVNLFIWEGIGKYMW